MSSPEKAAVGDRINAAMRRAIAAAVLTNERIARSFGLNVVDLQTLGLIAEADRPMTAGEISQATGLPTSTTTRVLDRLERGDFVRRAADPSDRRKVVIEADIERMRTGDSPYAAVLEGMRLLNEEFTPAELDTVARYLETMNRQADVGSNLRGGA